MNIDRLSDTQFKGLLSHYYVHMEKRGFCIRLEDAIQKNKYYFLMGQRAIGESILHSIFTKDSKRLTISVSRQYGKTSLIVSTIAFAYQEYYKCFSAPLGGCIVAPEKGTASEIFRRLAAELEETSVSLSVDNKGYKETIRGDSVELMSIHPESRGGTKEGRTNSFTVRDECHLGDDSAYLDQILPTMFRKEGPEILVGNGAYEDCYFSRAIKHGDDKRNKVFRYTYTELKPEMEELAKAGLYSARVWIDRIDEYITSIGDDESLEVRKNIFCELMSGVTSEDFLSQSDLDGCAVSSWKHGVGRLIFLGYDVASIGDRSIVTFMTDKKEIIDWLVIRDVGVYMTLQEQCNKIKSYCEEKGYLESIAGIGVDSTGLGIGAWEIMTELFSTEVIAYNFSAKTKHQWYNSFREFVRTPVVGDKISFNKTHTNWIDFSHEALEMEVEAGRSGNYLSFHAPERRGSYDDFIASGCIANSMVCNYGYSYGILNQSIRLNADTQYIGEEAGRIRREPSKKVLKRPNFRIGSVNSFLGRYAGTY